MDLAKAIILFREVYPEWADQADALYRCDEASKLFLRFLGDNLVWCEAKPYTFDLDRPSSCTMSVRNPVPVRDMGVNSCGEGEKLILNQNLNPDPSVYRGGMNEMGKIRASWHYIVETDTCFIDWTARQYTKDVDYPHIIPKLAKSASA